MTDQEREDSKTAGESGAAVSGALGESGDPGRTPGTAEGDEETVDEDLREKESGQQ